MFPKIIRPHGSSKPGRTGTYHTYIKFYVFHLDSLLFFIIIAKSKLRHIDFDPNEKKEGREERIAFQTGKQQKVVVCFMRLTLNRQRHPEG
jgi:hypothetical protein